MNGSLGLERHGTSGGDGGADRWSASRFPADITGITDTTGITSHLSTKENREMKENDDRVAGPREPERTRDP